MTHDTEWIEVNHPNAGGLNKRVLTPEHPLQVILALTVEIESAPGLTARCSRCGASITDCRQILRTYLPVKAPHAPAGSPAREVVSDAWYTRVMARQQRGYFDTTLIVPTCLNCAIVYVRTLLEQRLPDYPAGKPLPSLTSAASLMALFKPTGGAFRVAVFSISQAGVNQLTESVLVTSSTKRPLRDMWRGAYDKALESCQ